MMRHVRRLGDKFKVSIPPDEDGFTGRECPNPDCLGYFKIQIGTGLKGADLSCHCPYCGRIDSHSKFLTPEQIEYARSVALKEITEALRKDMQDWGRELRRSTRNSFIKLDVEFKGGRHPIRYYREKQLETVVVCDKCTLRYAIYGVFAFCPDCGTHNSRQILDKNLELAEKELALSANAEKELADYLIGDALENAVSALDGFGREWARIHATKSTDPARAAALSFQNLPGARKRVSELFGIDLSAGLTTSEWEAACRGFQKRHLLAHKMGVIDQSYIDVSGDAGAIVGHKVSIGKDDALELVALIRRIGSHLSSSI